MPSFQTFTDQCFAPAFSFSPRRERVLLANQFGLMDGLNRIADSFREPDAGRPPTSDVRRNPHWPHGPLTKQETTMDWDREDVAPEDLSEDHITSLERPDHGWHSYRLAKRFLDQWGDLLPEDHHADLSAAVANSPHHRSTRAIPRPW